MDPRPSTFLILFFIYAFSGTLIAQNNAEGDRYIYTSGDLTIISTAERPEGTTYKVEVARLPIIDSSDPELERLKQYGELFIETLDNKDLKSLLIGNFDDKAKAKEVEKELRKSGYSSAEVLEYKNGLRQE